MRKKAGIKDSDDFVIKSLSADEMNSKLKNIFGNSDMDMAQSLTQLEIKKVKIKKVKK